MMVGPTKILTVSYGTFSCTLEGFDEPFSTMKAIAEYFRDLAANDRYFGAEPPVPDVEMLNRIAEREIQRRVETRIGEEGIVLRQTEAPAEPASVAAPVQVAPTAAAAVAPVATDVAELPAAEPEPEPEAEPVAAAEIMDQPLPPIFVADDDTIAAKLARIRAAFAAQQAEAAQPEDDMAQAADSAAFAEDFAFDLDLAELRADSVSEAEAEDLAEAEAEAEADAEPEAEPVIDLDAIMADATPAAMADTAAAHTDDDGEAGIEAVADLPEEAVATDEEPEPEATEAADVSDADLAAIFAEDEAGADAEPEVSDSKEAGPEPVAIEVADETEPTRAMDDDEAEAAFAAQDVMPETSAGAEPEAEVMAATAEEADEGYTEEEEEEEPFLLTHAEIDPEETAQDAAEAMAASDASGGDRPHDDDGMADGRDDDAAEAAIRAAFGNLADEAGAEVRAEPEALAVSEPKVEDVPEIAAEAAPEDQPLRKPGFFERARARVIRIRRDPVAEAAEDAGADLPEAAFDAGPEALPEETAATEAADPDAVSRLMDEAASKLEGAENKRRFSAIAHLKAAVAATVADRKLKANEPPVEVNEEPEDQTDLYREDLSRAVRPRRPAAEAGTQTQRPQVETKPAPLVLVSEQRIDHPADLRADPAFVRPRRVMSGALTTTDEDDDEAEEVYVSPEEVKSFAEFAERMGAADLPELLEAAAAYTSTVEGNPHFSRPQILNKVARVSDDDAYTREDGMRSFGMLLRQGKIQKVRRGQFMLTDVSRFMTEARRAAQ
jgi:hypothetical protein